MRVERWRVARALALATVFCIGAGAPASPAAAAPSKAVKPISHGGTVKVRIGQKTLTYYRSSAKNPVELSVAGPTPLRILSRHIYGDSAKSDRVSYSLRVEIDGVVLKTTSLKAGASGRATLAGGAKIGGLKESIVQIPAGQHAVRIYPTAKGRRIALRLYLDGGTKSAGKWIPFAPDKFLEAARLHEKDRETTYYRFNQTNPVELTIRGPLSLRVHTRLDFGTTNGYSQKYVARCLLDGKPWKSFALSALASHTATYPEHPEITPGAERLISLSVPYGPHQVTVLLDGTAALGGALRIQVNQKQLNPVKKLRSSATSRG
jgi:hypothetical protein